MYSDIFEIAERFRSHPGTFYDATHELGLSDENARRRIAAASEGFRRIHLENKITAAGLLWLAMIDKATQEAIVIKLAQRVKLDEDEWRNKRKRAVAQRKEGATIQQIADELGASKSAVARWVSGIVETKRAPRSRDKALELRGQGYSVRQIARLLSIPPSTVHRWVQ